MKAKAVSKKKENKLFSIMYLILLVATTPVYMVSGPLSEYVSQNVAGRRVGIGADELLSGGGTAGGEDTAAGNDRAIPGNAVEDDGNPEEAGESKDAGGSALEGAEEADGSGDRVEEESEESLHEPVITYVSSYADEHYFDDAIFIGDSRTVGLYDYSGIVADYYCSNGYCAYQWLKGKKTVHQNTRERVDLNQVLMDNTYGKVYLMVGLNDGGFGTAEDFRPRVSTMLACIMQTQPDAVIFLLSNLHTSEAWSNAHPDMGNPAMVGINNVLAELAAADERVYYLDVNPLYCDENGNLRNGITTDGVHLHASQYSMWTEFLKAAAVYRKVE
ncbi:MAG: hypothetical protein K6E33_08125 [Lachnospiraceae bacterium]|nr:hypothetical protein [Lachnospiraceae bacterium]